MSKKLFWVNYRNQCSNLSRPIRESCSKWLGYIKQFMYARPSNLFKFNTGSNTSLSGWLRRFNNAKQSIVLRHTVQRTNMVRLDNSTRQLRNECNKSYKHKQSGKSSESVKSASTATARTASTTTRTTTGRGSTTTRSTASRSSTGTSSTSNNSYNYYSTTTNRECNSVADSLWWQYAEYTAASTERQGTSTRVRTSDEPRYFKQADAESRDSIERRIGIPAGVTI